MGMFDYVRVEYVVPDLPNELIQRVIWQTKDFDNFLDVYVIGRDGGLYQFGEKLDYTGEMCFYGFTKSNSYRDEDWMEFYVKFEEGNLVRISNKPIQEEGPAHSESAAAS